MRVIHLQNRGRTYHQFFVSNGQTSSLYFQVIESRMFDEILRSRSVVLAVQSKLRLASILGNRIHPQKIVFYWTV